MLAGVGCRSFEGLTTGGSQLCCELVAPFLLSLSTNSKYATTSVVNEITRQYMEGISVFCSPSNPFVKASNADH